MHLIYNLSIFFYSFFIHFAALFNQKAKDWVNGRKKFFIRTEKINNENLYWFHCASLGEFDQALPVINLLKERNEKLFILVTFFSPSGYLHYHKRKHKADYVCYLPIDSPKNAEKFIKHFNPKCAFFVKYEFWANYIFEAKKNNTKIFSLSAIFRENQHFFKKGNRFFKSILEQFDYFFVQNEESINLLKSIGLNNCQIMGDTRYDRVIENKQQLEPNKIIEKFLNKEKALIIGSSWPEDEKIILSLFNQNKIHHKLIIAPHSIEEKHIQQILQQIIVKSLRFSELNESSIFENVNVLIIDSIGQLANAYNYGEIAYVGGGFSGKLHNILEPTVFELPVLFGPKHTRFPEAQLFIQNGNGFSIHDENSFITAYNFALENITEIKSKSINIINLNKGASQKVMNYLNSINL